MGRIASDLSGCCKCCGLDQDLTKEDWVPPFADKWVFILAPAIVMVTTLLSFAVIPVAPGIIVADLISALLFFLAMSSLGVYSVVLAGWSSDNKYSLLGGMRAAAQMLSYEVFMGLSLMGVVMLAGSFRLPEIVEAQRNLWFVIPQFLGFVLFFVAGMAETRRIAIRSARGRERTDCGISLGILRHEVRNVLRRRIRRDHAGLGDDHGVVFRRLAGPVLPPSGLVFHQDIFLHLFFILLRAALAAAAF